MANRTDAILARKGEIMKRALGMDYAQFEQSPIAFDYEAMMAAHGYSLDDIVGIQTRGGVGNTPLLELRNLTDLVRSLQPSRAWARASSSRTRPPTWPAPSRTAERACRSTWPPRRATRASSPRPPATTAPRSRARRRATTWPASSCQEAFDSRHIGQPEIIEKSRICEAFGAEVVQLTVGPELFSHMLELLDETGYFAASLYSSFGVSGIETLGLEIADEMRAVTGKDPDAVVITHAGGGNTTGTARGLKRAGATDTQIVSASVDLSGLHMASDTDFNRKSFTTGHTGFGVPFATWPDRADVPRNAARSLRYMDRYLTVTQGEVFYVTEAMCKLEGLERGPSGNTAMTAAMSLARTMPTRRDHRGAGDRVHRRRQAPLGAAQLRARDGRRGARGRPARERAGQGHRDPRASRADRGGRLRPRAHAQELRAQRALARARGLRAHGRRHRVPCGRHQQRCRQTVEATIAALREG